jgi:hypothetical protein
MKISILPVFVIIVFSFCIFITYRSKKNQSINTSEALSIYLLLLTFAIWTLISIIMGIKEIHTSPILMQRVPLLWQTSVAVVLVVIGLIFSRTLRSGLRGVATGTPWNWFIFFQALRIGALGGVMKGIKGEVTSTFVFWVGIPDFLFGFSALIVGGLYLRKSVGARFLMIWNLIGAAVILGPTMAFMSYFMNEPGFIFIFEFPMVLAPSIVVPIFVLLNLLLAWRIYELNNKTKNV